MLRHNDQKGKYVCKICNRHFKMRNYLVSHMRSHTGLLRRFL